MSSLRAEYETQRAQILEELGQIAPGPLLFRLSALIRPAIALGSSSQKEKMPSGASKLGGSPDTPPGFEWPHSEGQPLSFVAQVNLEDLAPFDLEGQLPPSGLLSFWMHERLGIHQKFAAWRVLHFQGQKWQKAPVPQHDDLKKIVGAPLHPYMWASVPDVDNCAEFYEENQVLDRELSLSLSATIFAYTGLSSGHQMFGFPENIQYDVRCECALAWNIFLQSNEAESLALSEQNDTTEWTDWELLLQIGGDDNADLMWGDAGAIYFLIRRTDLQAARFDRCWFVFQCC